LAGELKKFIDQLDKAIRTGMTRPRMTKEVAETVKRQVKDNTRAGFGIQKKSRAPLKKLKPGTVRRRQTKNLSGETNPSKSNLTETGKMLDTLEANVTGRTVSTKVVNTSKIEIAEVKVATSQESKAKRHNKDRRFMDITKNDETKIAEIVAGEIARQINKINIG